MSTSETSFFRFCPNCSSKNFTYQNNFKFHCSECDFVLYHNIAAAVALVFTYDDKILFTERNVDPDKGKLDLPGGFIDPNETAEEAACREISEELGLTITTSDLKYITTSPNNYIYKNVAYRTMDIFYECKLESDVISINAADEIKSLIWIKRNEIDLSKIGFVSIRSVIGDRYLVKS
jgi:NADH pyrophosphatase NudC (nudix superfamily)